MSGLVPKLRFKQDDGSDFPEWEAKRLEDVVHAVNSGLTIDQNEVRSGYKVTRIETISDGSVNLSKVGYVDTNSDISNYLLNEGDILFSNINSVKHIGKIALINNERELYHGMNLLRIIPSEKMNSFFLYTYLKTTPIKRYFERVCNQAVSQASINQTELKKTKVVIPSLPEQQKIADFLSSIDAKIDVCKGKLNAFESYKRGLMQQIFSQKIRFKQEDGSEFPEWELLEAGDLFRSISNKKHSGDLPILSITQESGAVLRDDVGIDIKATFASVSSYKVVEPGDFIISLRSFQGGIEYSSVHGICSPAYTIMKPTKMISDGFYKYFMKSADFVTRLSLTVVGIRDGKQISYNAFSELPLPYPSLPEQQKIADFLSSVDAKIDAIKIQIEKLEAFKKGLLQQMFV